MILRLSMANKKTNKDRKKKANPFKASERYGR